jgi:hypothetical protein
VSDTEEGRPRPEGDAPGKESETAHEPPQSSNFVSRASRASARMKLEWD